MSQEERDAVAREVAEKYGLPKLVQSFEECRGKTILNIDYLGKCTLIRFTDGTVLDAEYEYHEEDGVLWQSKGGIVKSPNWGWVVASSNMTRHTLSRNNIYMEYLTATRTMEKQAAEKEERAEYERLKAKYEGPKP